MKTLTLITLTALAPLSLAFAQAEIKSVPMPPPTTLPSLAQPSAEGLAWSQKNLASWPEATRRLGAQLMTRYGAPTEVTSRQVTWVNSGQWARTTLYKEGIAHNFAAPHRNVLEQAVLYKVPVDKLVALAQFNRSLVVDLARGELVSRADSEEINNLEVDVAGDGVQDER